MKANIHPKWHPEAKVVCTCGNTFTVGSTLPEIQVEICAACHPFFTGEIKYVDAAGRVEKFEQKRKEAKKRPSKKEKARLKAEEKRKKEAEEEKRPKTFKEMLQKKA